MGRTPEPESFLPLKTVELLILIVLEAEDRHGYAIRQAIVEQTDGGVAIEAGNLYRHIRALEAQGLLTTAAAPRAESDARRIYYRLKPLGRRVLAAELRRLQSLVHLGEKRGLITRARA